MLIGLFKSLNVCFMLLIDGFEALIGSLKVLICLFKSLSVCFMLLTDSFLALSGDSGWILRRYSILSRKMEMESKHLSQLHLLCTIVSDWGSGGVLNGG